MDMHSIHDDTRVSELARLLPGGCYMKLFRAIALVSIALVACNAKSESKGPKLKSAPGTTSTTLFALSNLPTTTEYIAPSEPSTTEVVEPTTAYVPPTTRYTPPTTRYAAPATHFVPPATAYTAPPAA